jgi:succinate dehydrogenase/fumarate reductase flavoprotein subunit
VVLACGGFPHDTERRRERFAHAPTGAEHWSAAPPSNTGAGLRLGESAGGVVERAIAAPGAWAPVSQVVRRDGTVGIYPHLIERAKPGVIAVTRNGRRFVNEAGSYHDFMTALFRAVPAGATVEAWLVCDHRFVRRYGLGAVKPSPMPLSHWVASGYLVRAPDPAALARACGIDAGGLAATLEAYNRDAREGRDPAFGRGSTPYNRVQGDPSQAPNPCVAPIERGPYYAVRVVPGSLGTFAGLRTDTDCRVLDRHGAPIPGLHACGNDMSSVMGGHYPSGGITLGPALTFAYRAAHALAGRPLRDDATPPVTAQGVPVT